MNGKQFEKQLKASLERAGFAAWKLGGETPGARVAAAGEDQAPRFTVRPPWDLQAGYQGHTLVLECKRTSGKNLPLNRVKDHQTKNIRKAAACGWAAGLAIYMPDCDDGGFWFLPSGAWDIALSELDRIGRKSLPFDMLRNLGQRVEVDPSIGRTLTYFSGEDLHRIVGSRQPTAQEEFPW